MSIRNFFSCSIAAITFALCAVLTNAQTPLSLRPDTPSKFVIEGKKAYEFLMDLKAGEVSNIVTDATDDMPVSIEVRSPTGESIVSDRDASEGYIFVAEMSGKYLLKFYLYPTISDEELAKNMGKQVVVNYSNKFALPSGAKTKATKNVNGYQVKIADESGDKGKTFLLISKEGKLKSLMVAERYMTGGFHFSDDPGEEDGANPERSAALMRSTPDKTGDGTPDVAVEYYTGGAHCCFEITFFELGKDVHQLETIDSGNDRLVAIGKRPDRGLRFQFAEQSFAYWNINFAQSPMPRVIYEFDKSDKLMPRFDLMKKPAPTLTKLRQDASVMRKKINLNPYTSPDNNFNDWDEPFWAEMLDLIYTGHEDLAWKYFDLVWPAKKKGKEKFAADFKEQLKGSEYAEWRKDHPH